MITGKYKCSECGYVGSLVYEFDDKDYELFKRQIERAKNK
jgi:predicted nucleic acid-binding Zn ribbon protein